MENVKNTSMEENESLAEEIQEVKQLASYRKEQARRNHKQGNGIATSFLIAGIIDVIACLGYLIFALNFLSASLTEDGMMLTWIFLGSGIVLGILMIVFSGVAIHKSKRRQLKSKLIVLPSEDYLYAKATNQNKNEVVYVDSQTELNSLKKIEERKFVSPLADLEDEEEASGSMMVHVVRNYDFFEFTSKNIVDRFASICKFNGIELPFRDSLNVLSHIGYSRFMIINNMNSLYRDNFALSLAKNYGTKAFLIDAKEITSEEQLVQNDTFNDAFDFANKDLDEYVFLVLKNIDGSKLDELLADFKDCIFDKNNKHKIKTPYSDKRYEMVPNLFFVAFVEDGLACPKDFLTYSSLLEINPSLYSGEKDLIEDKKILVSDFKHVLDLIKKDYSLDENIWRKLDGLEKFVSSIKPYKIENDIVNDIENHVSYLMSMNVDSDGIVDAILAEDLLPSVLALLPKERVFGEDSLEMYISDNFESDFALPKVDALLRDYSSLSSKIKVEIEQNEKVTIEQSATDSNGNIFSDVQVSQEKEEEGNIHD